MEAVLLFATHLSDNKEGRRFSLFFLLFALRLGRTKLTWRQRVYSTFSDGNYAMY